MTDLAEQQTRAAWAAAHAAELGVVVQAIAAIATFGAIVSAFVVQRRSAKSAAKLAASIAVRHERALWLAIQQGADTLIVLSHRLETELLAIQPEDQRARVATQLALVSRLADSVPPNAELLQLAFSLLPLLTLTEDDLSRWGNLMYGRTPSMTPDAVRAAMKSRAHIAEIILSELQEVTVDDEVLEGDLPTA